MTTIDKVKWVLGIVVVFLLVLTTNLVDRQNFRKIQDSIETIYADRLVAQDIILRITRHIWAAEREYMASEGEARPPQTARLAAGIDGIAQEMDRFAATTLVPEEEVLFARLRTTLGELQEQETAFARGESSRQAVRYATDGVKEALADLSDIQMKEGRRQLHVGKQALSLANLFTQLEIGALIILALAVQVIILYSPGVGREVAGRAR